MNIKAISISILSLYIQNSYAYIPSHLEKVKQSDECIGCDLTQIEIRPWDDIEIKSTDLKNSLWTKSSLHNDKSVDFSGKNLEKSNFVLSGLQNLKFNKSIIDNGNFTASNIQECKFDDASLKQINFSKASNSQSQFTRANLSNANFENSSCYKCVFMQSNLENAVFIGAKMQHSNFYGSNITQDQLDEMQSYACAILPDGTVYDKNGEIDCD
ncbi:TPA: pentapeptide repeat-containing protein [Legionella pneumophila]|nr:pentapeptide repeat-containing protein [Legionella pneumophila]HBD7283606.1 pentapeptide repeat-containing protein [Legionella pneumophila]HBD9439240.1 pentapeptide repeat-containing protein [Legionella pneumophila]HEN8241125.1 pentapeptide repeat-containing protein [Legionella pneumophila]